MEKSVTFRKLKIEKLIVLTVSLFLILLGPQVISQTGPGGVGNATGINGQPANSMWLDASAIHQADGSKIQSWPDRSGNTFHAIQETESRQPVFLQNGSFNISQPTVRFTGNQNNFLYFSGNTVVGSDYTIIVVAAKRQTGRWFVMGGSGSGGNNNLHFGWQSDSQYEFHHWGNNYTGINLTPGAPGTGTNSFGIMTLQNKITSPATARPVFQNNLLLGSGANGANINAWEGAGIGGSPNAGNSRHSDIDVAEVIFYRNALNQAQLQIVNQYLNIKYGIAISNSLYSPVADYQNDVAGIGRGSDGTHSEASSAGFFLSTLSGGLVTGNYLFTSHNGAGNSAANFTAADLPASVESRFNRIWYLSNVNNTAQGQLAFDIPLAVENGEFPGMPNNYVLLYRSGTEGTFSIVKTSQGIKEGTRVYFNLIGESELQNGYYTLGTTDSQESPLAGKPGKTWFSLISGDWDNWETWTLDPAGAISFNPQQLTPSTSPSGPSDKVVILNGKTVTLNSNAKQNASITVNGRLDINTTSGHEFSEIRGNGRIILNGDHFPAGNAHHFYTPGQGQGTVVYRGSGYELLQTRNFYNVEIDLDQTSDAINLVNDYTIHGNLIIKRGAFTINNNVSTSIINLIVDNDVIVEAPGSILTGEGDTRAPYQIGTRLPVQDNKMYHSIFHQFVIGGNLLNNGTIRLTNQQAPVYNRFPLNGAVTTIFTNAANNTATLNGITHFYNLIIDKGEDKTYMLEINSSEPENFVLFGANNVGRINPAWSGLTPENPQVRKALWIKTGTLKLSGKMHIPTLTEGGTGDGNGDYAIGQNARLWIASPQVTVYTTASQQSQIPGFESATNTGITPGGSNQALSIYGEFRITHGFLGTRQSAGFIFWSQANAQIKIEGGTVDISQLRSSGGGLGTASYTQTGGLMIVRGNVTESGEVSNSHPIFGFEGENGVFNMSGGEILFHARTTGDNTNGGFYIPSKEGNFAVSGGKITVDINGGNNFTILSNAPVYDLEIKRRNDSGTATVSLSKDLQIINDLVINPNTTLTARNAANNDFDLFIGRDFDLKNGGRYHAHTNTTHFNSSTISRIYVRNTTNTGELKFNNLHIIKDQPWNPLVFRSVEVHSNGRQIDNPAIEVLGNLWIERGQLNVRNLTLSAKGNVEITDGRIFSSNSTNQGRLLINGPDRQTIKGSLSRQLDFGNVELDNDRGARLGSHISVTDFFLTTGIMDLGTYNLRIAGAIYPETGFNQDRMFQTEGNASDGGLSIRITQDATYLFPIGTNSKDHVRYTPLVATYKDVVSPGFVTLSVAAYALATLDDLDKNAALSYYWRIRHSDFSEELPLVESYVFTCSLSDYPGSNPWGGNWRPGKVVDITRSSENGSNLSGANITFNSGFRLEEGSYTAAVQNAFTGNLRVFYSRGARGMKNWSERETWSYSGHDGAQVPAGTQHRPGPGDIVVIGYNPNGDNQYHWVRMNQNNIRVAEIRFAGDGSTWNPRLYINAGDFQNLGKVSGRGDIRLNVRPGQIPIVRGDLGDFLEGEFNFFAYHLDGNGTINIPSNIDVYPNLRIESTSGSLGNRSISFQADIHVKRNMVIDGNSNVILHNGANGNITIGNNLNIGGYQEGRLQFSTSGPGKTVTVNGNLWIRDASNNSIEVLNSSPNNLVHRLQVGGNIVHENGSIVLFTNNNNGNNVELELIGNRNADYTRTSGTQARLYRLIMNKNSTGLVTFSFMNSFELLGPTNGDKKALELISGRLGLRHSGIDLMLTSGGANFRIPAGSELWLGSNCTVRASGNNTGIWLDGKLTLGHGAKAFINEGNNNYIEYTASGNSEIDINSGNSVLLVGSQIRRSTQTEEGILNFRLRNATSSVIVGTQAGQVPENNRGVFEILNAGSNLEMVDNSKIIIANAQNNPSFPTVYLKPATHSLGEGSLIQFGADIHTSGGQVMGLFSEIPLRNITLHNYNNSNPAMRLWYKGVEIAEDLLIQGGTEFRANNWNVNIKGDWNNAGNYISGNNTTVFSGSRNQTITGETEFWRLHKTSSHTLNVHNNIIVGSDLKLLSGMLRDHGNTVTVKGHIENHGVHEWGNSGDGVILAGNFQQNMISSGEWGKITINNPEGVMVETSNHQIIVNNAVNLVSGVFDIGRNMLLLRENAVFIEGNTYSETNMVQSNLSFTDNGIKKIFPNGFTGSFVYPIGSMMKYTPVILNNLSTGAGSLRVKAANEMHPSVIEDGDACMANTQNALRYHWTLEAADGLQNFTADVVMEFYREDALFTPPNALSDYIAARLIMGSDEWNKFDHESFDHESDLIKFQFISADASGINGDYTAGVRIDCGDAIPDNIPVYISVTSGNWSNPSNWAIYNTSTETIGEPGENIPTGGPRGVIAIIAADDVIVMDQNFVNNYRTIINGVLDVNTSYAQRIGIVDGDGELYIYRGDLPAAVYDHFIQNGGSTFHFGGTGDYDVLNQLPLVNNVRFSGTGQRRLPNLNFIIRGSLEINGDENLHLINEHNRQLEVRGDINFNGGNFVAGTGNSKITLNGQSQQTINGSLSFTDDNSLWNLEINNPNNVMVHAPLQVKNILTLNRGILNTQSNLLSITNSSVNAVLGHSTNSYVAGPITRLITGIAQEYTFPVGNSQRYRPASVSNVNFAFNQPWTMQYFGQNPTNAGMDSYETDPDLESVNNREYWGVEAGSDGEAQVKISWGPGSGVPEVEPHLLEEYMTVANWDSGMWRNMGQSAANANFNFTGNVTSLSTLTFLAKSGMKYVTTASTDTENVPLPIELLYFTAQGAEQSVELLWATAVEINNDFFTIERSKDGIEYEIIATLPSKAPHGTSNQLLKYNFTDLNPLDGLSYYRLKQTDFDGSFEYSQPASVFFGQAPQDSRLTLFPNPNRGHSFRMLLNGLSGNETLDITVTDTFGRRVYSNRIHADFNGNLAAFIVPHGRLNEGVYMVIVEGKSDRFTTRLIVQ